MGEGSRISAEGCVSHLESAALSLRPEKRTRNTAALKNVRILGLRNPLASRDSLLRGKMTIRKGLTILMGGFARILRRYWIFIPPLFLLALFLASPSISPTICRFHRLRSRAFRELSLVFPPQRSVATSTFV
jgi:hypothetical protein